MFLWGGKRKKQAEETSWVESLGIDLSDWDEVFSVCLGKMTAVQTAFGDQVVGDREWHIDFSRGAIAFGDREFPIQLIGSESDVSDSWLWGWQNVNGLPEEELRLASRIRAMGERWGLEALTEASFALSDSFNGHNLSVVACGLSEGCCYYRCPHANGAVFVAISGAPETVFAPVDACRFIGVAMRCVDQFDVDHRIFIEAFLVWNKTAFDRNGLKLVAHFAEGDLEVEFVKLVDGFLRIVSFSADYLK